MFDDTLRVYFVWHNMRNTLFQWGQVASKSLLKQQLWEHFSVNNLKEIEREKTMVVDM